VRRARGQSGKETIMLTFEGRNERFCDGVSRRGFLKVGTLGIGGLTMADLLRNEAQAKSPAGRNKAVIMIYLPGGPTHMDTYDLKPDAPTEFRGEFKPIRGKGEVDFCELFPKQASIGDKLAVVRGLVTVNEHSAHMVMTGFPGKVMRPAFGSVVSRLGGSASGLPPYVSLMNRMRDESPEYLGSAHKPFVPSQQGLSSFSLVSGVTQDRLEDRKSLLGEFDSMRREMDADGSISGMDAFTVRALDVITSDKARAAFDVSKEPSKVRDAYGKDNTGFLQARRLVEAGVRVVTLSTGGWDSHSNNFQTMRRQLPKVDQAIHALVSDLHERGLADDVSVVMWGEFGRTPRINKNAGRDHWPSSGFALLAGGGMKTGQVIGESDSRGERPKGAPVTPSHVLSTLYTNLGIDPGATVNDSTGRPMYLLEDRQALTKLL